MLRKLGFGLIALLLSWAALAAEVGGVRLDDKASVGGQELVLNGAGLRSRFMIKIYVGSLYLPARATDLAGVLAKGPRRVQMNLLRDLSGEDLVGALVDGLKANSSAQELTAVQPQTDQLVTIMKSFGQARSGSVVTLDFVGADTKIGFDGQAKGSIAGEPFNAALMRIWLGSKPAQDDLKKAMLGG